MGVDTDIKSTIKMLNSEDVSGYGNIYPCTNEDLRSIYSSVDFENKDVLSVMASGDHVFMSFINGAKSVSSFDINKLALYYFYLRLWTIKYHGTYYPEPFLDSEYVSYLLNDVKVMEPRENQAYEYWKKLLKKIEPYEFGLLFFVGSNYLHLSNEELNLLRERLYYNDVKFYNIDISGDVNIDKKFDIVVTSNIVDWLSSGGCSFKPYMNNLDKLLKKDGFVLSSNLGTSNYEPEEKDIFSEKFEFKKLIDDNADKNWNVVAFQYKKTK